MFQITTGRNFFKRRTDAEQHFLEESSTESIAKESIVEMRDITPESIITVTAFRDETMDMRIPFKIPAESMIKPGVKFLCLFILENKRRTTLETE